MQKVIDRVLALLAGEPVDLSDVPLDFGAAPEFHQRAYDDRADDPRRPDHDLRRHRQAPRRATEAREVGQAMGKNPIAIIMPCHRVLGADGKMGGFSANGGVATKRRILEIEGAAAVSAGPLFAGVDRHRN